MQTMVLQWLYRSFFRDTFQRYKSYRRTEETKVFQKEMKRQGPGVKFNLIIRLNPIFRNLKKLMFLLSF